MSMGSDTTWVGKKPLRRVGGMSDALSIAADLGYSVAPPPSQVSKATDSLASRTFKQSRTEGVCEYTRSRVDGILLVSYFDLVFFVGSGRYPEFINQFWWKGGRFDKDLERIDCCTKKNCGSASGTTRKKGIAFWISALIINHSSRDLLKFFWK